MNGFDLVDLKGSIRSSDVGWPDLPIRLIHLILPTDRRVGDVLVINEQPVLLEGEYLILPTQPDQKTDEISEKEWVDPDPEVYNSDSLYPSRLVEVVEEGYLAGNHLVTLALHPLQYQPKSRKLFFYKQLNINVELEPSEKLPLSSRIRRRSIKAQRLYEKILQQVVDNRRDIPDFICKDFPSMVFKANIDSFVFPSYLVVTTPELKPAFLPLVDWKNKKGTDADIVCIDSILLNYSGRDDAEKLRNFLIDAYQNGTSWVLLGGDEDVVPIRYAYPTNTSIYPPNTDQQICDLYFSDVDGEWDQDNDGIWGEPRQDSPDLFPDLFVGRVPANDTTEVKAFVEKLISYERNPGNGSTDYLTRALWMSSDQMRDWNGGEGQHQLVSQYIPISFSQDLITLIESPTGDAQNPVGPDGRTCVEVMNQGWGIIGVLAHGKSNGFVAKSNLTNGTPKSWVFTAPGGGGGHGHLPNLNVEGKYGIMYSISCSQSAIDVDKYPSLGGEPCVGEFYPLALQKGGVAFLGYSRWGWVNVSYQLFEKFSEYLFDNNLGHHIGVAEALSRCAYPSYRDIDYGHNLFGDPEMQVWTEIPKELVVDHPNEVNIGWQTINFFVTSQGAAVGSASVCLSLRERMIFLGQTDQEGRLSGEMNLDDVGEMSVVVTKHNYIPYVDSITISLLADVGEDENGDEDFSQVKSFSLFQNYPNPFNPITNILFAVKSDQDPVRTTIRVYNLLGERVRTLLDEPKKPGNYQIIWDGKDEDGKEVSSGIYLYTLEAGNYRQTKKMILMK